MLGTPPPSLCKSMSVKRRAMDHGGRSPFTGNWPNGQALPHCGTRSSLGVALNVLPNAELLAVDAKTSAACPKQLSTKRGPPKENNSFVYRSILSLPRYSMGLNLPPAISNLRFVVQFRGCRWHGRLAACILGALADDFPLALRCSLLTLSP